MMKLKVILFFTLIFYSNFSQLQIIDRFGVNLGSSYSSQLWNYKLFPVEIENDYKFGLQGFIQAEKDLGKIFSCRMELGYIEKGFKSNLELVYPDGSLVGKIRDNVIVRDLAVNLGFKIKPLQVKYAPYILLGFRGDYMINYKDIIVEESSSGLKFNVYESIIEDFSKYNFGGIFGLGINLKELLYFEIDYNPNFTKNLNDKSLSVKDNCWGIKLGLNINCLISNIK